MFRLFCYLYRRLPADEGMEDDSDSDKGKRTTDVIKDEFRIYKTKELRIDEIMAEAKILGMSESLFSYDPDNDGF